MFFRYSQILKITIMVSSKTRTAIVPKMVVKMDTTIIVTPFASIPVSAAANSEPPKTMIAIISHVIQSIPSNPGVHIDSNDASNNVPNADFGGATVFLGVHGAS